MNGCCIPGTLLAVDYWRTRNCPAKLFFLSHMHADHTSGLSSSWKDRIYCSEISAKLLKAKFNIRDELICPLETGMSHVVDLDVLNSITITVTLIDAHHCPGAVMFLFEGYFGTILYTGDFRFCDAMLRDLDILSGKIIDVLYFDNTYNSEEFYLPSREYAKEQVMQIIEDNQNREIVLGMHSLGKEDLLVDIARRFQTWIVVSPEKMSLVKLLDLPDVFTTDISAGWIRVEKNMKITKKNIAIWNKEQDTIAILPTALYFNSQDYTHTSNIHVVPYSDHSSYYELLEFVAHIKPKRLIPIVKEGNSYAKRSITHLQHFDTYLDQSPQFFFTIPEVLQNISFNSVPTVKNVTQKTIVSGSKRKHSLGVQFYDSPEKQQVPKRPKLDDEDPTDENCVFKKNIELSMVEMNEDTTVIMNVDENSHLLGENSHLTCVTQQKDVSHSNILYYFQRKGTTLSDNPEVRCSTSPKSLSKTEHNLTKDYLSTENNCGQNEEVEAVKTEPIGNPQDPRGTSELTSPKLFVLPETEQKLNDDLSTENNCSQNEEVIAVKTETSDNTQSSWDASEPTSPKSSVLPETEHNHDYLITENNCSEGKQFIAVNTGASGKSYFQDKAGLTAPKSVVLPESEHNLNAGSSTENNCSQVKTRASGNSTNPCDTSELTSAKSVVLPETEHNLYNENHSSQIENMIGSIKTGTSGNPQDFQNTSELTPLKSVALPDTEHDLNDGLSTENNCQKVKTGTSGNYPGSHDASELTSPKSSSSLCLRTENNYSQGREVKVETGASGNSSDSLKSTELTCVSRAAKSSSSNPVEPSFDLKKCQKVTDTSDHRSCTASCSYILSISDITELLESQVETAMLDDLNSNHKVDAEYFKSLVMGLKPEHMMKTKEEKQRCLYEAFQMF
ncbi:DNA cross-link repair 1 protein-like [Anneissia japonica]|uniref:DNA cross-link repair 1 protein-like n=1 Tax=Anneissia japonica TaxID=1529436 RepID=UPI0014259124|nr:DNA cross-link repair 1 protein-like [Anneissia japonica]